MSNMKLTTLFLMIFVSSTLSARNHNVRLIKPDSYAQRRVVTVNQPVQYHDNIQEGKIKGVQTIVSQYGENHAVKVSKSLPNIIITPFVRAKAMGLSKDYDLGTNGSAIIITPRSNRKMWISITDQDNPSGTPISLTLIPKNIGSQTIIASIGSSGSAVNALAKNSGFSQQLSQILKAIAMRQLPAGFSIRPLNNTFSMAGGINVQPVERYSSHQYDIYRYRLLNQSHQTQTLSEEMFGANEKVVAVSFFPRTKLHQNESTDVLIMTSKER